MEDNNYPTTKKEYNEGEPQLRTSPLGASTPGTSPFQSDMDDGLKIPDNIDYSITADYIETSYDSDSSDGSRIGDHSGFSYSKRYSAGVGKKVMFIIVPLMLIIGAVLGAFAARTYYFGFEMSAEQSAATDAVNAVYDYAKEDGALKIVFTDVYVLSRADEFECVVFTVIEDSRTLFRTENFRVISEKGGDKTEVIPEFDQEVYDRLHESADSGDNIMADWMLNQKHEYEQSLEDIIAGKWVNVNPSYTSSRLRHKAE